MRLGSLGASGTTGGELVRLLLGHDGIELGFLAARESAGRALGDVHPYLEATDVGATLLGHLDDVPELDVAFLSLPNGESARRAPELLERGIRVIDLSGGFRLLPDLCRREGSFVSHLVPAVRGVLTTCSRPRHAAPRPMIS
jgi:N-acetyl-gamma-glutamylphosphate reductase